MIGQIGLDEGQLCIAAIDRAGGGEQQVPHRMRPQSLEQIGRAHHIGLDIALWRLEAVANTGLGGEMHHDLRPGLGHRPPQQCCIFKHALNKAEGAKTLQLCQALVLEGGIIIGRQTVEPDNIMAAFEQQAAEMKTDEASSAGD